MIKGFRDFLMRGNILELAIAVVIGTAFVALVTVVTNSLIKPLIDAFAGGSSKGLGFYFNSDNPKTYVDISAILNAGITFVITAAVVYFVVVVPLQRLAELRKRGQAPVEATVPEDIALLTEIRDLLRTRDGVA